MKEAFRRLWANKTAKILLVAGAALVLLLVSWLVFGREETRATSGFVQTEQEERLAAILSEVEDAGNVSVMITQEGGVPVSAIVMFDGSDGILVRLRLTQITARALDIAENRVLVCPSDTRKKLFL